MKKRIAVLLAFVILTPIVLTGCMTAEERAAQRKELDEIGSLAEEYMIDKYNRLFNVKKCEYAVGDEYEGDYFITFTDSTHAYYDTDEEVFYDDRQADAIIDDIYSELWMPMIKQLGGCDAITQDTQNFCMKYKYSKGNTTYYYSMFHEYYYNNIKSYANSEKLSIQCDTLYFASDGVSDYTNDYDYILEYVKKYFKNQSDGDLRVFIISDEYCSSPDFDINSFDVTADGFIAEFKFGNVNGITLHQYVKVSNDLYAMLCNYDSNVLEEGDVKLVEVSDSDTTEQKILDKIDENSDGLVNSILKTRGLSRESSIYRMEFSERIAEMLENGVTFAFSINENGETDSEKSNDYGFYAYDTASRTTNITCLSSYSTQAERIEINNDTEWYLWLGNKPSILK